MVIKMINNLANEEQNKIKQIIDAQYLTLKDLFLPYNIPFEQVFEKIIKYYLDLESINTEEFPLVKYNDFDYYLDLDTGLVHCSFHQNLTTYPVFVFNIFEGEHLKILSEHEYLVIKGLFDHRYANRPDTYDKANLAEFMLDFDEVLECYTGYIQNTFVEYNEIIINFEDFLELSPDSDTPEETQQKLMTYRKPDLSKISDKFKSDEYEIFDDSTLFLEEVIETKKEILMLIDEQIKQHYEAEDYFEGEDIFEEEEYFEQTEKITFHVSNNFSTN